MAVQEAPRPSDSNPSDFQAFVRVNTDLDYVLGIDPSKYLVVGEKREPHSLPGRGGNIQRQYFAPSAPGASLGFTAVATLELAGEHSFMDFRVERRGQDGKGLIEAEFMRASSLIEQNTGNIEFPIADTRVLARYTAGELIRIEPGSKIDERVVGKANKWIEDGRKRVPTPAHGVDVRFAGGRVVITRRGEVLSVPFNLSIDSIRMRLVSDETRSIPILAPSELDLSWKDADLLALFDVREELIPHLS